MKFINSHIFKLLIPPLPQSEGNKSPNILSVKKKIARKVLLGQPKDAKPYWGNDHCATALLCTNQLNKKHNGLKLTMGWY